MSDTKRYIAVDLGAESGRVMLSTVDNDKLDLTEIYRFSNGPIETGSRLQWDFQALFGNIKTGIAKAIAQADGPISSIGVDSWGVDFGLLDKDGKLIENPYNYRDSRTDGMIEKANASMGKENLYNATGTQFMQFNTLYQLMAAKEAGDTLQKADKLIFMADLVSYHLCGVAYAEYSLASTSQLMDMSQKTWSKEVLEHFGLPAGILPDIIQPGTIAGKLKPELCKEFNCEAIDIVAVGSHDTASAVAAVPASVDSWAYLSCGTWSLLGIETPDAIINQATFDMALTNEGGVENTIRLLKNIMGLWLLQESKRQWARDGVDLDYSTIAQMAADAAPFAALIDPDQDEFFSPGDMPNRINEYLKSKGDSPIEDKGQLARVILESLAMKYRKEIIAMEKLAGKEIEVFHLVGGGIQNELLCQFAANATGKKVVTGPVEATASGNILMQAMAAGQIESLTRGRELIARSFETKEFLPRDTDIWKEKYQQFYK